MSTRDIRDELLQGTKSYPKIKLSRYHFLFLGAVFFIAIYVYNILYGNNSILKLFELKDEKRVLTEKIESLKDENAKLQYYIYELNIIRGDE